MTEPTPQPSRKAATPLDTRLIKKWLIWLTAVALAWLAWKADSFYAYYQFKQLCKTEAGLQVFEKLEPGVGWTADSWSEAKLYPWPKQIPFVRTKADRTGQPVDVVRTGIGTMPNGDDAYWGKPVDAAAGVLYRWGWKHDRHPLNQRIGRTFTDVTQIESGRVMVRETSLAFGWRDGSWWTILGPTGVEFCPPKRPSIPGDFWKQVEQKAFKE